MRPEILVAAAVAGGRPLCLPQAPCLLVTLASSCSGPRLVFTHAPRPFRCPAAAPPIIFWARIFLSAQRRQAAIDAERTAEEQRRLQREVRCAR